MSLLTDWREFAYSHDDRTREGQEFWIGYFNQEKAVYEQILATPEEPVSGTVTELAQKYNMELTYFVGFLDGINDSLKNPNSIRNREVLQQLLSHLRLDVMIHVHAEVVRNTKSVVAEINNHE